MYPKNVPDIVADQSNQTSINNITDAINNVCPALSGGNKHGVKPLSNIKSDMTHEG